MPTRHQPILAMVLLAVLAGGSTTLPALAQQGGGGESTGGSDAGPSGGDSSGASGTTGDLNAPQGQKSSSDVQDPTSGAAGGMAPAVSNLSQEQVRRVQQRLVEFGHDPGMVDGIMGGRTRDALRSFQQSRGIEPTGVSGHFPHPPGRRAPGGPTERLGGHPGAEPLHWIGGAGWQSEIRPLAPVFDTEAGLAFPCLDVVTLYRSCPGPTCLPAEPRAHNQPPAVTSVPGGE